MGRILRTLLASLLTRRRLRSFLVRENAAGYQALAELAGSGVITPVIFRT